MAGNQLIPRTTSRQPNKLRDAKGKKKKEMLDKFLSICILRESHDAYSVFRLILPAVRMGCRPHLLPLWSLLMTRWA